MAPSHIGERHGSSMCTLFAETPFVLKKLRFCLNIWLATGSRYWLEKLRLYILANQALES